MSGRRNRRAAQGDVIIADANLKTANVNLGYTEITAPITGEIGRTKLTKGNVVGPDSGVLTAIVSRDPMYVTFPVSQREFLKIEEEEATQGEAGGARGAHPLLGWLDLRPRPAGSTSSM